MEPEEAAGSPGGMVAAFLALPAGLLVVRGVLVHGKAPGSKARRLVGKLVIGGGGNRLANLLPCCFIVFFEIRS